MECQEKIPKAQTRKVESIDVHAGGGLSRSSVEAAVMVVERRG